MHLAGCPVFGQRQPSPRPPGQQQGVLAGPARSSLPRLQAKSKVRAATELPPIDRLWSCSKPQLCKHHVWG